MLANLANELAGLGFTVHVFDQDNRLTHRSFDWLCLREMRFTIADVDAVFSGEESGAIVTSWLNSLMPRLLAEADRQPDPGAWVSRRLRYWCQGELLRDAYENVREFCRSHLARIAINNQSLSPHYRALGFSDLLILENWIRNDLFSSVDAVKSPGTVGHQPDKNNDVLTRLREAYGDEAVVACTGNQAEVASKMRKSDFYVFWNEPSPFIMRFKGETFGLSLFEAMACGCVCVGSAHEGNRFLKDVVALVDDLAEVRQVLDSLRSNAGAREKIRSDSVALIEGRFRFDAARKAAAARLVG